MTRRAVDFEALGRRLGDRCFICELIAGNPEFPHHIVYEDDAAVAFLNAYPPLYGYVLVVPREHREQVTGDFSRAEYLQLQDVVRRVGEAIRQVGCGCSRSERDRVRAARSAAANRLAETST